ncbi:hypothetical protein EV421DRAFT_1269550 [Armillaria borealis]|uniref:Uncharacterized protein n=1 Tax=Armillaria borealis TaxID=47425 RepID=A0AA39J4Y1_9AGAR|nr:hypothetical protein EV421DRAFT_1269550 [Armillaria borealis]
MLFLISTRSSVSSIPQTLLFWAMRTFIHAIPMWLYLLSSCRYRMPLAMTQTPSSDAQSRTNEASFLCMLLPHFLRICKSPKSSLSGFANCRYLTMLIYPSRITMTMNKGCLRVIHLPARLLTSTLSFV